MGTPRPKTAVFQHTSQTQWGRAVVASTGEDRTTYMFEHAGARTFKNGHAAIEEVSLPEDECQALAASLLKAVAKLTAPPKKKREKPAAKPAKLELVREAFPIVPFERQLAIFRATYPGGFSDPKFLAEERGTAGGPERRKNAAITLARDILRLQKLDLAIGNGDFSAVFAAALKVLTAFDSLSLPKSQRPAFMRIPERAHPDFARALRDVLHGDGPYAPRFDTFVASLPMRPVPWTIATLFSAAVHPEEHVFLKPTVNQRQAAALDLPEPPLGDPTGAGYAEHLAIAITLRDRLVAAGLQPRDLFDVHTFGWRTLTRRAQTALAG